MALDPSPAGPVWVSRYPTSRSLDDLVPPFGAAVGAFVGDLEAAGCTVTINATRRPEPRAFLMRGAWDVAHGGVEAAPAARPDVPILWTLDGARAMVRGYGLVYRPSLTSRHIAGRAVDITITYPPGMGLEDAKAIGLRHGVHHLDGDDPHWSDDGK